MFSERAKFYILSAYQPRYDIMNLIRRPWISPLIALFAVLLLASVASACPSCKAALGDSPEGQRLVRGYFLSICFMVAMPFTIFGSLSAYMYWLVRAARRNGGPQSGAAQSSIEKPVGA